jgi:hypothetical protein
VIAPAIVAVLQVFVGDALEHRRSRAMMNPIGSEPKEVARHGLEAVL